MPVGAPRLRHKDWALGPVLRTVLPLLVKSFVKQEIDRIFQSGALFCVLPGDRVVSTAEKGTERFIRDAGGSGNKGDSIADRRRIAHHSVRENRQA
ncbi:hypothetical protein RvVAT039_07100 [Agrobacterium vitis]|nr:hypothetical protein RvVAT039_07100 [Agrobacterium vitis]